MNIIVYDMSMRKTSLTVTTALLSIICGVLGFTPHKAYAAQHSFTVKASDGTPIRVFERGDRSKPIIYLVHGLMSNHHFFDDIGARLASNYRVISYDGRGHGLSGDREAKHVDLYQVGSDFSRVIHAVQGNHPTQKAFMAGHSMGGMVLGSWLKFFPQEQTKYSSGLGLCNTALNGVLNHTRVAFIPVNDSEIFKVIAPLGGAAPVTNHNALLPIEPLARMVAFYRQPSDAQLKRFIHDAGTVSNDVTRREIDLTTHINIVNVLSHVKVPTTVMYSDGDMILPEILNKYMIDKLRPTGHLHAVHKLFESGHASFVEYPVKVYNIIKEAADTADY